MANQGRPKKYPDNQKFSTIRVKKDIIDKLYALGDKGDTQMDILNRLIVYNKQNPGEKPQKLEIDSESKNTVIRVTQELKEEINKFGSKKDPYDKIILTLINNFLYDISD